MKGRAVWSSRRSVACLLYVSAMFHRVGLTEKHRRSQERFEIVSSPMLRGTPRGPTVFRTSAPLERISVSIADIRIKLIALSPRRALNTRAKEKHRAPTAIQKA